MSINNAINNRASTFTVDSLTSGRVIFASTAGLLVDDADFTFATDTLTVTKIAATSFTGTVTLSDVNIVLGTTTGTKIGTATNQKLGFFNATPIVQPTGSVITALQNLGLVSSATLGTIDLVVGTTTVSSGTTTKVLFDNVGVLGEYTISGSGNVAMTTSPVFTTPTLGVASATTINKITITAPATGATLTIDDGFTLHATGNVTALSGSHTGTSSGTNTGDVTTTDNALTMTAQVISMKKAVQALVDGATITWNVASGYNASVTLGGNRTLAISNPQAGDYYTIIITQDGTGNRTLVLPGGSSAALNLGVGGVTTLIAYYNGSTYFWTSTATNATNSLYLANDFTTSNTTATSTNLAFAIAANESYTVVIEGTCKKATSATGLKFAIDAPTGATIKGEQYGGGATLAASQVPSLITTISTLGTTLATGTNIEVTFRLAFRVTASSTAGNITLQAATVTSNTLTVFAGTRMTWVKNASI